jgi:hypothetical protein
MGRFIEAVPSNSCRRAWAVPIFILVGTPIQCGPLPQPEPNSRVYQARIARFCNAEEKMRLHLFVRLD